MLQKPTNRPKNPYFGSGPSAKRPGWNIDVLRDAVVGRSHRSIASVQKIKQLLDLTRKILNIPDDYLIAIMPGSDTGAMEAAMWSMLGPRQVDAVVFDRFGELWLHDIEKELKIKNFRAFTAPVGRMPELSGINCDHDVVFCWNGTTTGVCLPNVSWIDPNRTGITICDATSAAFGIDLPWAVLDVVTFSWQKILGSEAAHGMIVLSPRAIERLESYSPPWPMPRLFRMVKDKKLIAEIFDGQTINTPSLLCVEDCLDALQWIDGNGGLSTMIERRRVNFSIINNWVQKTPWINFLVDDPLVRSQISVCLKLDDADLCRKIADLLAAEGVAFDIMGHREAPPNLRIWAGGMIEAEDIQNLLPWIDWAYSVYSS